MATRQRKERHDRGALNVPFRVNQRVYLRDHAVCGHNRIQDAWGSTVYQVVRVPKPGGIVYSVASLSDLTHEKQVHRTES